MGLEESRLAAAEDGFGDVGFGKLYKEEGSNSKRVRRRSPPWSSVHQCGLYEWMAGQHEYVNFEKIVLTCSSKLYSECSPGFCMHKQSLIQTSKKIPGSRAASAMPLKRAKFSKMAEHLEYNHIPASLSSIQKFRVKSILCHSGSLMVLHLVRNTSSQFGAVDFCANKFLGIFAKQPLEFPAEAVRASIAPDEIRCLLLMPSVRHRYPRRDTLLLCDLRTKEILTELLVPGDGCQFAFDPRFTCLRVALTYSETRTVSEPNNPRQEDQPQLRFTLLNLYDCGTWRKMGATQLCPSGQSVRRLQYSPAGHLLLAVTTDDVAAGGCHCRGGGNRRRQLLACQLVLHDSDSLLKLRRLSYFRMACHLHSCPTTYCPAISRCGSRIAFAVSLPGGHSTVLVRQVPQPRTLKAMAREVVLQIWSVQALSSELALPKAVINYLKFSPEFSSSGVCQQQMNIVNKN